MAQNHPYQSIHEQPIVVVSGLPRSGTSMMMAMLEAGGVALLADGARAADADNPNGYYELERVKQIARDRAWLLEARGKAVKIISFLLPNVSDDFTYKVIFMRRALPEILASQRRMLERRGESAQSDDETMTQLYEKHLRGVGEWMAGQAHMDVLYVDHADTLSNPMETVRRVNTFLGEDMDLNAMVATVDSLLYRQRA